MPTFLPVLTERQECFGEQSLFMVVDADSPLLKTLLFIQFFLFLLLYPFFPNSQTFEFKFECISIDIDGPSKTRWLEYGALSAVKLKGTL